MPCIDYLTPDHQMKHQIRPKIRHQVRHQIRHQIRHQLTSPCIQDTPLRSYRPKGTAQTGATQVPAPPLEDTTRYHPQQLSAWTGALLR